MKSNYCYVMKTFGGLPKVTARKWQDSTLNSDSLVIRLSVQPLCYRTSQAWLPCLTPMSKLFSVSFLHNTLREKIKLFLVNIGLGDSKYFWVDESFEESDESHSTLCRKVCMSTKSHIQGQDFIELIKLTRGPWSWRSELLT